MGPRSGAIGYTHRVAVPRTLNLRLTADVYEALKAVAQERGTSMNKVVEESILVTAAAARKARLRRAFAKIAEEDTDVEFAFEAQREVVLADG